MSDEPIRPGEAREQRKTGIWEHYCEHPGCKEWGSFGYKMGAAYTWYCLDHRPDNYQTE